QDDAAAAPDADGLGRDRTGRVASKIDLGKALGVVNATDRNSDNEGDDHATAASLH
ncbi:unnamed protein product, partial [Amoebophrya sp. A120]